MHPMMRWFVSARSFEDVNFCVGVSTLFSDVNHVTMRSERDNRSCDCGLEENFPVSGPGESLSAQTDTAQHSDRHRHRAGQSQDMNYDEMDGPSSQVFHSSAANANHAIIYANPQHHHHQHQHSSNINNSSSNSNNAVHNNNNDEDDEEERDHDHEDNNTTTMHASVQQGSSLLPIKRARGKACSECRRLKVKCIGADDDSACERCRAAQRTCTFADPQRKRAKTEYVVYHCIAFRLTNSQSRGRP